MSAALSVGSAVPGILPPCVCSYRPAVCKAHGAYIEESCVIRLVRPIQERGEERFPLQRANRAFGRSLLPADRAGNRRPNPFADAGHSLERVDEASAVADEDAAEDQPERPSLFIEDHLVEIEVGVISGAEYQPQARRLPLRFGEKAWLTSRVPDGGLDRHPSGGAYLVVHERPDFFGGHSILRCLVDACSHLVVHSVNVVRLGPAIGLTPIAPLRAASALFVRLASPRHAAITQLRKSSLPPSPSHHA